MQSARTPAQEQGPEPDRKRRCHPCDSSRAGYDGVLAGRTNPATIGEPPPPGLPIAFRPSGKEPVLPRDSGSVDAAPERPVLRVGLPCHIACRDWG
jgi:hypothetical protein